LLEQKVRTVGNKTDVTRTRESILKIYDNSIYRLYDAFRIACGKFDSFYFDHIFYLSVGNSTSSKEEKALIYCREAINHSTNEIEFQYYYKQFNQAGFGEFNYNAILKINLGLNGYRIHLRNSNTQVEKKYYEQLTNEEVAFLVKAEVRNHKNYIESEIKKITDKNS
jgi:hypothetical protein